MAQKRLSAEEKCKIMLQIFQSKREIFQLKEIEKLCVKRGIVLQSVKEILQSLIDDNFVTQEKLGTSNYYWSFVRDEGSEVTDKLVKVDNDIISMDLEINKYKQEYIDSFVDREVNDKRDELIKEIQDIEEILQKQENDMHRYAECDPRVYKKRNEELNVIKNYINEVTEDIFTMQTYLCEKFGMDRRDFNENFGVDDEMEEIDFNY